jgi:hypothetical protein
VIFTKDVIYFHGHFNPLDSLELLEETRSPGTPVSSTNKTDHHHITEILLKGALNTITLTPTSTVCIKTQL